MSEKPSPAPSFEEWAAKRGIEPHGTAWPWAAEAWNAALAARPSEGVEAELRAHINHVLRCAVGLPDCDDCNAADIQAHLLAARTVATKVGLDK